MCRLRMLTHPAELCMSGTYAQRESPRSLLVTCVCVCVVALLRTTCSVNGWLPVALNYLPNVSINYSFVNVILALVHC